MKFNMKRFYAVSLFLITFFTFSSISYASEGGLLDGKSMKVVTPPTSTDTSTLTDRNATTGENLYSSDKSKKITYIFPSLSDLTAMQFNISAANANTRVYFYSAVTDTSLMPSPTNPNLLGYETFSSGSNRIIDQAISYKNVKQIIIHSTNANYHTLYEFDVFGTTYAPDTVAPGNVGNLTAKGDDMLVDLTWENPTDKDFAYVSIFRNGVLIADKITENKYTDLQVINDTSYDYRVVSVDTSGNKSIGRTVTVTPTYVDTKPPDEITDLQTIASYDSVTLTFKLPTTADFDHVTLYKDGVPYADSKTGKFEVLNLDEATMYSFRIVTVDKAGNASAGVVKSIATLSTVDETPPAPPTGLAVTVGNGGLNLTWNNNLETDLDGYNIYVDGTKVNTTPIRKASYVLSGLKNSQSYMISVTAVDKSSNESAQSQVATGTPSSDAIPVLGLADYDLNDVAGGIGSWFSSLWLIIAFSAAIPLAFYVSNRIKLLFIA